MEQKDPPIDAMPDDAQFGKTIIDFGDIRISKGFSKVARSVCRHTNVIYSTTERKIWCKDCQTNVDAFDAFKILIDQYAKAWGEVDCEKTRLDEALKFNARSLAVKSLDEIWRGRNMAPCCPHCRAGLLPEDFAKGVFAQVGREYELRRRGKAKP